MKSIISFIFIFGLSLSGWGEELSNLKKTQLNTQDSCESDCENKYNNSAAINVDKDGNKIKDTTTYNTCIARCARNSQTNSCDTAYKAYTDSMKDNPCPGVKDVATCRDLVNRCEQSGVNFSSNTDEVSENNIGSIIGEVLGQVVTQQQKNIVQSSTVADECFQIGGEKAEKKAEDIQKKLEDKKEKIAKTKKELNEQNQKLNDEVAKVKEEQAKLEAEIKKNIQKLEVDKRERLSKIAQEIQETSIKIRQKSNEVIKIKRSVEDIKFNYSNKMLDFSKNEGQMLCKKMVESAQSCYKRAKKGEDVSRDSVCSELKITASAGKGAKGATNQKNTLAYVQSKCQEQFDVKISTLNNEYQNTLKDKEMELKEKNAEITDTNEALALKQKETEQVSKELDKEKSLEEENLNKQIANFTEKLQKLEENIKKSIKDSEETLADLQKELNDMMAIQTLDGTFKSSKRSFNSVLNISKESVDAIERAQSDAIAACGCDPSASKQANSKCSTLVSKAKAKKSTTTNKSNSKKSGFGTDR